MKNKTKQITLSYQFYKVKLQTDVKYLPIVQSPKEKHETRSSGQHNVTKTAKD